jgi:hypothetical protein
MSIDPEKQAAADLLLDEFGKELFAKAMAFSDFDEEKVTEVATVALLASSPDSKASFEDIGLVAQWLHRGMFHATVMTQVLCGAIDITVDKGEVNIGIRNPDRFMEKLIKAGIAKPKAE